MYSGRLIADDARMDPKDCKRWVDRAYAGAFPVHRFVGLRRESAREGDWSLNGLSREKLVARRVG